MRSDGLILLAVAAGLAALAVDLGAHAAPAAAAGAAAIALATVGILVLAEPRPPPSGRTGGPIAPASDRFYHRDAFHLTPLGRERIIATLDRLELRAGRPAVVDASGERLRSLRRLPPDRFREHVRHRIEALEAGP